MSQAVTNYEVLTLEEADGFLRISPQRAHELAARGVIPGRCIDDEWRFLRSAMEEWLRGRDYRQALLNQAGALKDDESLTAIREMIYAERGRAEIGDVGRGTL